MSRTFPEGFRWGTATAAHQVEGGNVNNDWWAWEHTADSGCVEPSGDACDQYHRYPADLDLLAALGFNSYRFSIEWSRIEPEEGQFSAAALDHYRRVCAACLERGMDATVTFHHFTTPRWAADDGGWSNPAIVERFARFCEVAGGALGDLISRACTINEPNIVSFLGYYGGVFPPGCRDRDRWLAASEHFQAGHRRAVEVLKAGPGDFPVGMTLSMTDYQAVPSDDQEAVSRLERMRGHAEDVFLENCRGDDFFGVQTYTRTRVAADANLGAEEGVASLVMGYEFYPQALAATIRRAWDPPTTSRSWSPRTASVPTTTTSASRMWAPPSKGCSTAWTTGSTCGATRTGARWTTSSGPSATCRASASSRSTAPPSAAR